MVMDTTGGTPRGNTTSVLLITRNRLLLESLPDRRGPLESIAIVGRALSFSDAETLLGRLAPRVLLLDSAAFLEGFRQLTELTSVRLGQSRVAVLAEDLTDAKLEIALACDVIGLLSAADSLSDLAADLLAVSRGEFRTSPLLAKNITRDARSGRRRLDRRSNVAALSQRQLDVLIQLASGKRVKEIADALAMSEKSIESHKYRLMNRLGFNDRVELCRWAIREGLIEA